MDYYVQIESGPAAGWGYHTAIRPPAVIYVAPIPDREGEWMRVERDGHPWPGEQRYSGEELPPLGQPIPPEFLTEDDEILARYFHTETY